MEPDLVMPTSGDSQAVTQQKEPPLVRAGRVANALTLERVGFIQFSAQRHSERDVRAAESILSLVRFTRPKVVRLKDGEFVISSAFSASFSVDDSGTQDVVASVRATLELRYRHTVGTVEFDDEDMDEFATVNVPFNSWGYWREFVQSSLARLGLPPVTIPLFRVQVAREWMLTDES
jgi:hypothetical protein